MITALTICHAIVSVLLIFMVLIHFGKGAEAGLVLDTSSSSILPHQGNFLNKVTTVLATLFLGISLTLAILRGHETKSLFDKQPSAAQSQPSAPVQLPSVPAPTTKVDESAPATETNSPNQK